MEPQSSPNTGLLDTGALVGSSLNLVNGSNIASEHDQAHHQQQVEQLQQQIQQFQDYRPQDPPDQLVQQLQMQQQLIMQQQQLLQQLQLQLKQYPPQHADITPQSSVQAALQTYQEVQPSQQNCASFSEDN